MVPIRRWVSSHLSRFERLGMPCLAFVVVSFASVGLRLSGTDWWLVAVAAVGAALLLVVALGLPRSWLPPSTPLWLAIGLDAVLATLRHAQGASLSGYAPLVIVPVGWVGLTQGRRAVVAITACTCLLFALPIALIGAPLYPGTGWRSVFLWTVVASVIGFGADRFVADARVRSRSLDRLVEAQSAITMTEFTPDAVMTSAAGGALSLTAADGACVELLEGDEVVCSAAAGVAVPFLGLRLKADESITGQCFRTRQVLICTDSEQDSRVAREACRQVGARSLIVVPLLHAGDVKGVLIVWSAGAHDFRGYESQLLALLANTVGAALARADLVVRLTEQAITDELTGLPNRRAWYQQLDQAIARARRGGQPLSILILDLDGFKHVNDQQGHAAGDRRLKTVTSRWAGELRTTDLLGRTGGDEFAVILELTDQEGAREVIERLERAVDGYQRASAGSATWDCNESADALVARADADMYHHKRAHAAA